MLIAACAQVAHEILMLQIITLLLEKPTDDSVELAISLVKEGGALMNEVLREPAPLSCSESCPDDLTLVRCRHKVCMQFSSASAASCTRARSTSVCST